MLLLGVVFSAERGEVIQGRFWLGWLERLRREMFDGQMALPLLEDHRSHAHERALEVQFHLGQVEGIEAQGIGTNRP